MNQLDEKFTQIRITQLSIADDLETIVRSLQKMEALVKTIENPILKKSIQTEIDFIYGDMTTIIGSTKKSWDMWIEYSKLLNHKN